MHINVFAATQAVRHTAVCEPRHVAGLIPGTAVATAYPAAASVASLPRRESARNMRTPNVRFHPACSTCEVGGLNWGSLPAQSVSCPAQPPQGLHEGA